MDIFDDHFSLLEFQVYALYNHDSNNRVFQTNEPDPSKDIPLFFLSRSTQGNLCRYHSELPLEIISDLEEVVKTEPVVQKLNKSPFHKDQYVNILKKHTSIEDTFSGPLYYLAHFPPSANTINVGSKNRNLLEPNFPYTMSKLEEFLPIIAIVDNGVAISICRSVRTTKYVAEAGVDTIKEFTGVGYATETVRNWANEVRNNGKIPFYSTNWDNYASLAVAKKLNAIQFGVTFSIIGTKSQKTEE